MSYPGVVNGENSRANVQYVRGNSSYLPLLDDMVREGLVVLPDVDVIKYTHRLTPVTVEEQSS